MRINSVQTNQNQPCFVSWEREVFHKTQHSLVGELRHRNDTEFFRDGQLWTWIVEKLVDKYKNVDKVNIYNYGCSNGSEPYTFLMQLFSSFSEQVVRKFLPIIAKDYDKVAITMAKSNRLPLGERERISIERYTGGKLNKFMHSITERTDKEHYYAANPILQENVQFSVANILKDYKKIKPDNSVVFARNFWPYLKDKDQERLAVKLYNQLGANTAVIIGDFDMIGHPRRMPELLWDAGFNPTERDIMVVKP